MSQFNRRQFIAASGALGLSASLLPGMAFARAATERRLVVILLRGAMDGLAAVPATGDPAYARLRGDLALRRGETRVLTGEFGLHRSLENLHELFRRSQAQIFHAVASPYRERSHFDGQDMIEHGGHAPLTLRTGWLNRALMQMPGAEGLAIGQNIPLILRGDAPTASWAPSRLPDADQDTIARLQRMYRQDRLLRESLQSAIETEMKLGMALEDTRTRGGNAAYLDGADQAAELLKLEQGARVAVLEISGWDTHARQGAADGQLANRLALLDKVIGRLRDGLAPVWDQTAVLVMTEFGRTVRVNGSGGTDHGTASAAFLFGGAVRSGVLRTDWPGLAEGNLYENRDLRPTLDLRALCKGVLHEHLQISRAALDGQVFPGTERITPVEGVTG